MCVYNIESVEVFGNGESSYTKFNSDLGHCFYYSLMFAFQENSDNSDFFENSPSLKDCISELKRS